MRAAAWADEQEQYRNSWVRRPCLVTTSRVLHACRRARLDSMRSVATDLADAEANPGSGNMVGPPPPPLATAAAGH